MEQPMPPQGAPQQEQSGGGVKDLIVGIHSSLLKLQEVLDSAQGLPPEAKQGLMPIIEGYKGFVMNLSKVGGQPAAPQQAAPVPSQGPAAAPVAAKPPMRGPAPVMGGPKGLPVRR